MMHRTLFALALTVTALGIQSANAQKPRNNPGLPKVDFQVGQITPVGQGLAIPVKNLGFERSPGTTVHVTIWDLQSRRLLKAQSFNVSALFPNQTQRVIVVPQNQGKRVLVRARVDPNNRVAESNERNNQVASQH